MKCQRCKKQEASVHLTDINPDGDKSERHLCDQCAQEEGVTIKAHPVQLNSLLSNFVMASAGVQELTDLKCDQCGLTFVEFRNQGMLGCPNDYDVFGKALDSLIDRVHGGADHHVGKSPKTEEGVANKHRERARLRRELESAVEREEYELAASLRDQLEGL